MFRLENVHAERAVLEKEKAATTCVVAAQTPS
jgi:hypothetical protein